MKNYDNFWFTCGFLVWLFMAWFCLSSSPKTYLDNINEYDVRNGGNWGN